MSNTLAIIIIVAIAIIVVVVLFWKNMKDKKLLNPDAPDSVDEAVMDKERRKDKI
jgi:FtsZ-interacting cell division protein ZipA